MVQLKRAVPMMEDRPQQDLAATTIERAIRDETMLVCQAGTGVGKSNAGLIPAITSGKRVVYATATKILQSQIVEKDLPFLQEHLGVDFTFASLKGWASYICHSKLMEFDDASVRDMLLAELEANPDHIGDREGFQAELSDREWMNLSISSDECPGRKSCPFGGNCRPQAARDRVLTADVAVVNHSVLATDALVQDVSEGGFSLVGPADVVIIDEAHELEEFISGVLGEQFTIGSIRHLEGQFRALLRKLDLGDLNDRAEEAIDELMDAGVAFFEALPIGRLYHRTVVDELLPEFERLLLGYSGVWQILVSNEAREATNTLRDVTDRNKTRANRERLKKVCDKKIEALKQMMVQGDYDLVRYTEEQSKMFRGKRETSKVLKSTPVSVAPWAQSALWPLYSSAILISATILIDGQADYIASRLGLEDFEVLDAGTPFDYPKQAVLFVPDYLPDPTKERSRWESRCASTMLELVKAAKGGALLLFTSTKQLNQVWDLIVDQIPYPCKRQGDGETNNRLMAWFRDEHDGVLFATRSFFTGASFEGDTCRLVVIDKLPFPVPTEPVFEARAQQIDARGGSSFSELTIPMMTLPLQQGAGRLIRTKKDRGVVAILDPRIATKGYGKKIVRSLPPMKFVAEIDAVGRFFRLASHE